MPRYRVEEIPEKLAEFLEKEGCDELKAKAALLTARDQEVLDPGLATRAKPAIPTRKAELAAFVQKRLEDPAYVRKLWEMLDPLQKAAVAEGVYSADGFHKPEQFAAKYGGQANWGARDDYGSRRKPSLLALFFFGARYGCVEARLPSDLGQRLREFVPAPPRAEVRTLDAAPATVQLSWEEWNEKAKKHEKVTEDVPLTVCETERAALHDVRAVLRLIDTGKVGASDKTKRPTGGAIKAVTQVLQGGDFYSEEAPKDRWSQVVEPMKGFAWPLLVQAAGLANLSGTRLQLAPAGRKALSMPPHEVIRTVWERWLKSTLLDEFSRISVIKGQTGKGARGFTALAERRATIARALSACPPNRWMEFGEFSRFMLAADHTFEVTRDPWSLYVADAHYGNLGEGGAAGWDTLQERYLMAFLFEYAATLGLIDIAHIHPSGARQDYGGMWGADDLEFLSQYDGLTHLRINGLGAWCLGLAEQFVPTAPEPCQVLKVLPNLDMVAAEPLAPGDALFLDQIAEKTSDNVWAIQRARLLKALEEGTSAAEIEAFLAAKSGAGLPETVAVLLRDMAGRVTCLSDRGPARVIEAKDSALAHLIANESRLRPLCMLAGERHLVVPAESEAAFRRTLRELGYGLSTHG